jgi:hypothetical protein
MTLALVTGVLVASGCGDSPTSPGIQPEIFNQADSFEYQVSDILNYSGTATYTWQNTGSAANLNLSTVGESGIATLTVQDAAGTQLFSEALDDRGTVVTGAGMAGEWTLRVDYTSFSGTVNFRAEKST